MSVKTEPDREIPIFGQNFWYNPASSLYVSIDTRFIDLIGVNLINQWSALARLGPPPEVQDWFVRDHTVVSPFRVHWLRCVVDYFESGVKFDE